MILYENIYVILTIFGQNVNLYLFSLSHQIRLEVVIKQHKYYCLFENIPKLLTFSVYLCVMSFLLHRVARRAT